ncbi:MAG TPA: hypothetical protein VF657_04600 [Actinoplanes sp.]|jgi:hypothetical protein
MRRRTGITVAAALVAAAAVTSTSLASAHENGARQDKRGAAAAGGGVVFVHSNDLEQNAVLAFRRGDDGSLTPDAFRRERREQHRHHVPRAG